MVAGLRRDQRATVATGAYADYAAIGHPGTAPSVVAGWISSWIWAIGFLPSFSALFVIYPSGYAVSRFRRAVVAASISGAVVTATGLALSDAAFVEYGHGAHNPLTGGRAETVAGAVTVVGLAIGGIAVAAAVVDTVVRLRRAGSPEREQLAWLVTTTLPVAIAAFAAPPAVTLVLVILSPVGVVVGVLRCQLLDIRVVLRRALVYGALIALIAAVYAGVVAGLATLVPRSLLPSVVAAALIAVGIRPAYELLQRLVGRLVYGDRADPVRALHRLGARLRDDADDPPLLAAARAVADALRTPAVEILVGDGVVASVGHVDGVAWHEVPLHRGAERTGALRASDRGPRDPLSAADRALLDALAVPVSVTVHAATLAEELRVSRRQVLEATDAERDRLCRDLHDGLGSGAVRHRAGTRGRAPRRGRRRAVELSRRAARSRGSRPRPRRPPTGSSPRR